MEPQLAEEQVLIDLGLTLKQARIYLALAKHGPSRIVDLANNAKVARPDVYPILKRLRQLSIVEKIIKTPPEYKAVQMKEVLPYLLEAKTNQYERIKAQTEIRENDRRPNSS
jgi:sugar-specific transcriptional regulator TrmB